MPEFFKYMFAFFFGASAGSFFNVCIHRMPLGLSVVTPPSQCPSCKSQIRFYDNIPIMSYLFLRGKCRTCGTRISPEYPLVEAFTAVLFVALYWRFGLGAEFFVYAAFVSALIVISFIDLRTRIIPNVISVPGIALGFILSFVLYEPLMRAFLTSASGIILGGGSLFAVATGYYYLTGKEGMGGGDVKLLAMIGAFLGWKGVLFTLMASSLIGSSVGVFFMLFRGKGSKFAVPFGPFLSLGALLYVFFGEIAINWYILTMFGP
ncbi:MAG: prepilin peptidase [Thermodesulfobacteriota bacterium]